MQEDAKRIIQRCQELQMEPIDKFSQIQKEFSEFTMNHLIIVKWIAIYNVFDFHIFNKYLKLEKKDMITNIKNQIYFYVKEFLKKNSKNFKINKFEIQKICNNEFNHFESEYKRLSKSVKSVEKNLKKKDNEYYDELRKELIDFVRENH